MTEQNYEFFVNNPFEYSSYRCDCRVEPIFTAPGKKPSYNLKVCSIPEKKLLFSYEAQEGLNLSGAAGKILAKNILGQLLALKLESIDEIVDFIQKYGFFFPVGSEKYESVDVDILNKFISRIKAVTKLMSAIAEKNDKTLLECTSYLLLGAPGKLELSTCLYETYTHDFLSLLLSYTGSLSEKIKDDSEIVTRPYVVKDTIFGETNIDVNEIFKWDQEKNRSSYPVAEQIFNLYTTYPYDAVKMRRIIDFYYNYQERVGMIQEVGVTGLTYYEPPKEENFTDEMKDALLQIAKDVVTDEINYYLSHISPQYDADKFAPSWKLNSLLEALYLSIFYMKPGFELYRACANPNCKHEKYFLVNTTRENKKYCCSACANAVAQQRARRKRKMNRIQVKTP